MTYTDRIISNPAIMLGKPVIKGTRIAVELVLKKLSEGVSIDELIQAYPHLTKEDILCYDGIISARWRYLDETKCNSQA